MSWLKFGKKKYSVIEHAHHDDGEVVDFTVVTNVSRNDAEGEVVELKELDKLFGAELDYSYSIVEMGALNNA